MAAEAASSYRPAAWVRALRACGFPVSAVLIAVAIVGLAVTGHLNLALLGLPGTLVAISLMHQLPRRLPPINYLGTRDLGRVEGEAGGLLLWALAHIALMVPTVMLVQRFPLPLLGGYSHAPELSVTWVLVAKVMLLGVPAIVFAGRFGAVTRQLGLRGVDSRWRWFGPLIPVALLCFGLAVLTSPPARSVPPVVLAALVGVAVVHAGFPEEAFYRALLQTRLELLIGTRAAIGVSSILFGLRHVPSRYVFLWAGTTGSVTGDLALTVGVSLAYQSLFGVLFGYMWMRYRNAWMNILGHTVFDFFAFIGLLTT